MKSSRALAFFGIPITFVVGLLVGDGAIFEWQRIKNESERLAQDQTAIESNIVSDLTHIERQIHELTPQYVDLRDNLKNPPSYKERVEFDAVKHRLTGLFVSYNRLEAKLSRLAGRGADFLIPSRLIPPRSPKLSIYQGTGADGGAEDMVRFQVSLRKDPVSEAVSIQLQLAFDQYGDNFKDRYYLRACELGDARFCTGLARTRTEENPKTQLAEDTAELYEKGCVLGDPNACEILGFNSFFRKEYHSAADWLSKGCALDHGRACGFLGGLQATDLLDHSRSLPEAEANLDRGCTLGSAKSCYFLAKLNISGLIAKNTDQAKLNLESACALEMDVACDSLSDFEEFKGCIFKDQSSAKDAISRDAAVMSIKCITDS